MNNKMEQAIMGGGCFWCIEAMFLSIKGVSQIESGYSAGTTLSPTYQDICSGTSNHAEVCRITYDPSLINYASLIHLFFISHDPTQLNKQDNDVGTQYRSIILTTDDNQMQIALAKKKEMEGQFKDTIKTQISMLDVFYKAEDQHQNYYKLNKNTNPYCQVVVAKKVQKFIKQLNENNMADLLQ